MPTLSVKVSTDVAAKFARGAEECDDTVSSLLRKWIEGFVDDDRPTMFVLDSRGKCVGYMVLDG